MMYLSIYTRAFLSHHALAIQYSAVENIIRRLLTNNINRQRNKRSRNLVEAGRINHSQAIHTSHAELPIEHSILIVIRTDSSRAASMVTPGVVSCILLQPIFPSDVASRLNLNKITLKWNHLIKRLPSKPQPFIQRLQIRLIPIIISIPRVKGIEIDLRDIARISGTQRDCTRIVMGVCLQSEPGPDIAGVDTIVCETWVIAPEQTWGADDEEVWIFRLAREGGLHGDADGYTAGCVRASTKWRDTILPFLETRVVGLVAEGTVFGDVEFLAGVGLADDADFVAVLHVLADAWEVLDDFDAEFFELGAGSDAAEF